MLDILVNSAQVSEAMLHTILSNVTSHRTLYL